MREWNILPSWHYLWICCPEFNSWTWKFWPSFAGTFLQQLFFLPTRTERTGPGENEVSWWGHADVTLGQRVKVMEMSTEAIRSLTNAPHTVPNHSTVFDNWNERRGTGHALRTGPLAGVSVTSPRYVGYLAQPLSLCTPVRSLLWWTCESI